MVYTLRFFLFKMQFFFHNSTVFGSCNIHILYTGVLKLKKNNSGAKRLMQVVYQVEGCARCRLLALLHGKHIRLHVQYILPDDEHTVFETCRRQEEIN